MRFEEIFVSEGIVTKKRKDNGTLEIDISVNSNPSYGCWWKSNTNSGREKYLCIPNQGIGNERKSNIQMAVGGKATPTAAEQNTYAFPIRGLGTRENRTFIWLWWKSYTNSGKKIKFIEVKTKKAFELFQMPSL